MIIIQNVLKLVNHLILTISSNPTLAADGRETIPPNFLSKSSAKFLYLPQDHRKRKSRKVRKKLIKLSTSCKNIQKPPED